MVLIQTHGYHADIDPAQDSRGGTIRVKGIIARKRSCSGRAVSEHLQEQFHLLLVVIPE